MEVGGTQRQIVEMATHADRSNFDISLVYFRNDSPYVDELRAGGVEVTCIRKHWKADPFFFIRLCRFMRNGEFDLVHAFSFGGEFWGWLANLFSGRAQFIGSARSTYEWYSPLQWWIKRIITLNSAALIANSHAGAEYAALRMGIRRNSVQVVHNGLRVPAEIGRTLDLRATRKDGLYRILFVGRLVEHKNVQCLARAFGIVAEKLAHARLEIIGDGPDRAAMEGMMTALGLSGRVTFHGERNDVAPFLEAADVFACTSHREGLSNAIMEAMGAGLPVIASNVGGNSELIEHEATGLLFPPDDHDSLAAMLIELERDPARRQAIGESACERIRRFHDPRRMAAELERIYERCLLEENACAVER